MWAAALFGSMSRYNEQLEPGSWPNELVPSMDLPIDSSFPDGFLSMFYEPPEAQALSSANANSALSDPGAPHESGPIDITPQLTDGSATLYAASSFNGSPPGTPPETMATASLCWGHEIKDLCSHSLPCEPDFVPGRGHMKNKFCAVCRHHGFEVPVSHVRVQSTSLGDVFINAASAGLWNLSCGRRYRLLNHTKVCKGPHAVLFDKPAPTLTLECGSTLEWAPMPPEWLSADGSTIHIVIASGTLAPLGAVTRAVGPSSSQGANPPKPSRKMLDTQRLPLPQLPQPISAPPPQAPLPLPPPPPATVLGPLHVSAPMTMPLASCIPMGMAISTAPSAASGGLSLASSCMQTPSIPLPLGLAAPLAVGASLGPATAITPSFMQPPSSTQLGAELPVSSAPITPSFMQPPSSMQLPPASTLPDAELPGLSAPLGSKRAHAEVGGAVSDFGRRVGPRYSIFASFTKSLPFATLTPFGPPSRGGPQPPVAPTADNQPPTSLLPWPPSPPTSPPWSLDYAPSAGRSMDPIVFLLHHPIALFSCVAASYFATASAFDLYATPWFKTGAFLVIVGMLLALLRVDGRMALRIFYWFFVASQAVMILGRALVLPADDIADGIRQTELGANGSAVVSMCVGLLLGVAPDDYFTTRDKLRTVALATLVRLGGFSTMILRTRLLRSIGVIFMSSDVPLSAAMFAAMCWAKPSDCFSALPAQRVVDSKATATADSYAI